MVGPIPDDSTQSSSRLSLAGKWIAWSLDERTILATGDTAEEIAATCARAGHSRFIYDWVPQAESRQGPGVG